MEAGLCRWEDVEKLKPDGDPVLDLEAFCNMNEILLIRAENRRRAEKHAERESKLKTSRHR